MPENLCKDPGTMTGACDPSRGEAVAGGSLLGHTL